MWKFPNYEPTERLYEALFMAIERFEELAENFPDEPEHSKRGVASLLA